MGDAVNFDLGNVFSVVAAAIPDQEFLVWRDKRFTYKQFDDRVTGIANYLAGAGLGCHTERGELAGHESGQDHIGLYLRNGNEYLETMIGAYRARVAPFNVSYRYVEEELLYLLNDSGATALVYNAEFAPHVAAIRDRLPQLKVLIQVADESGHDLLPGAVDYESSVATAATVGTVALPQARASDPSALWRRMKTSAPAETGFSSVTIWSKPTPICRSARRWRWALRSQSGVRIGWR